MIEKLKELFSFSVTPTEQKTDIQTNIEIVSCPLKEMMCKVHHTFINNSFLEAEKYRKEKDFDNSIESLTQAFNKATELMALPCNNCARQFLTNIVDSMANIHFELEKKSNGIFAKKSHKSSYLKAVKTLREFKEKGILPTTQINNNSKRFLGNHLN